VFGRQSVKATGQRSFGPDSLRTIIYTAKVFLILKYSFVLEAMKRKNGGKDLK
jgi:hypothetical protein